MHFPSLFLFNAAALNAFLCVAFGLLAFQFWRNLRQQPDRITRAIALFFSSAGLTTGWSSIYTTIVLIGVDSYPMEMAVLFVRDIVLTVLLASVVYLVVELRYGNGNH